MFEQAYASHWHHPVSFWAVGAIVLALLLTRLGRPRNTEGQRFVMAALLLFQVAIALDAWLTGPFSPLESGSAVAIVFVVLGDLRYFVLLERFGQSEEVGRRPLRWLLVPLGSSLIVPIASKLASSWSDDLRVLFLTYEIMFAVLAAVVLLVVLPRRQGAQLAWARRLTQFELAQYAMWATADAVILLGYDLGFALRLVPNLMYYAAFVPFAWLSCPRELRP